MSVNLKIAGRPACRRRRRKPRVSKKACLIKKKRLKRAKICKLLRGLKHKKLKLKLCKKACLIKKKRLRKALRGVNGLQGPLGVDGVQGLQGLTGLQGPEGPQGPQGPQGLQGLMGPQGLTGPQGSTGRRGSEGPRGSTGPQGPAGDAVSPAVVELLESLLGTNILVETETGAVTGTLTLIGINFIQITESTGDIVLIPLQAILSVQNAGT